MQSDVSFERRFRYQEMAIARLMCEARLLRDENAQLLAQLEQAGAPGPAGAKVDRLEATLPAGPSGPATARAALTRWLTGQVPGEVLSDARVLASELVATAAVPPICPRRPRCGSPSRSATTRCALTCAIPAVRGRSALAARWRPWPAARRGARQALGGRRRRWDPSVVRGRRGVRPTRPCSGRRASALADTSSRCCFCARSTSALEASYAPGWQ